MKDFEKDVQDALAAGGPSGGDREQSLWEMVAGTFRGRNRWMTILVWVWMWVLVACGVVAAVQFFRVGGLADKLMYATLFVVATFAVGMMKMWYWMLMNRNSVLREIKRLELRIAELQATVEKK